MNRKRNKKSGSVLVIALWSLFLLTIFAVQLAVIVRQKITLVHRLDQRDRLFYVAEAGIKKAIVELRKEDAIPDADVFAEPWGNNTESFKDVAVGNGYFNVSYGYAGNRLRRTQFGVMDEESKINLNTAPVDILLNLLQLEGGLDADQAYTIAYAVIDWRDADSFFQHPQYGAEDADYEGLKAPYESKDGPFELIDELLLVKGMDEDVFARIKDHVTVYGEGRININTVQPAVLKALGLNEKLAEDILAFREGEDMIEGTADDRFFTVSGEIIPQLKDFSPLSGQDEAVLEALIEQNVFVFKSNYYRARSLARLHAQKPEFEIIAVLDRSGHVQYWHESFR